MIELLPRTTVIRRSFIRRGLVAALIVTSVLMVGVPQVHASTSQPLPERSPCEQVFVDVGPGHPFCKPITYATIHGLVGGYWDGTFRPASNVTREALTAWIYRAAGAPWGPDPACVAVPFSDVGSSTFCGEIEWATSIGLVQGFPGGTFRPTTFVTRQAAAAMFFNFYTDFLVPPCDSPPFVDVPTTHQFCGQITWMVSNGFTVGWPDGSYRPTALVTRQAAAVWVGLAHKYPPGS